jgi:hypothetical protein
MPLEDTLCTTLHGEEHIVASLVVDAGWVKHRPDGLGTDRIGWGTDRIVWGTDRSWVENRPRELKSKKKSAGRKRRALEIPLEDKPRTTLQGREH